MRITPPPYGHLLALGFVAGCMTVGAVAGALVVTVHAVIGGWRD